MATAMKTTKARSSTVSLAHAIGRTHDIREAIRALEAEAKALRPIIDSNLGNTNLLIAGEYALTRTMRERRDLDKDLLRSELGERFSDFEKVSVYAVLEIKKVRQ
jgi:predicted phage-related endonuclease